MRDETKISEPAPGSYGACSIASALRAGACRHAGVSGSRRQHRRHQALHGRSSDYRSGRGRTGAARRAARGRYHFKNRRRLRLVRSGRRPAALRRKERAASGSARAKTGGVFPDTGEDAAGLPPWRIGARQHFRHRHHYLLRPRNRCLRRAGARRHRSFRHAAACRHRRHSGAFRRIRRQKRRARHAGRAARTFRRRSALSRRTKRTAFSER